MSDSDQVLEIDRDAKSPGFDRRSFLRRTAMTGVAAGSVGTILSACGSSASSGSSGGSSSVFGNHKNYKFVFVNHVTTNPFFTPTQYGAADACKLLGCSYQWTGSENSNVSQMVNAINTAVTSGADGIAVALIDLHAFNAPVEAAIKAGIPVVAYNADAVGNARLAYIGQDLKKAGEKMGERIKAAVGSGEVGLFIATPGSANLQPRIEGAEKVLKGTGITTHAIATGAAVTQEEPAIEAWYQSHKNAKGMYAVDGGSTESLAKVMQKLGLAGKVHAGGFDLTEQTQKLLSEGDIEFTIDQQPYLQGFLPVLELFMYKVSGTLTGMAEVDTGLKFLDKETVQPYLKTKTRYEGTASAVTVVA
ncbi:MAG: simple sugar transport system substrate-binding protein [Solirubrobacteraceae bacterium]|nr:sugar transporter, periplasmic sugar-binding protein [Solirubrobacterales bacterium]MEA2215576.1 simple sugar transport system substrate-binding protein [Solirubrobacteraceae bacterium]